MRKLTGNVVAEKADVENEILTCHLHIQQEQLPEHKGGDGRDQLLDVIQTELRARPDDTDLNIRLVALCCSSNKLRDAVLHCQEAEKTSCRVKLGMVFLCHTDIGGIQSDFDPVVIFRVLETSLGNWVMWQCVQEKLLSLQKGGGSLSSDKLSSSGIP
ncbi:hypothetical protein ASZ78_003475 [Callipepla squamata]|uniref:Uncharacterized protein n=1 Tax=Callipepla squamata TaxID=9009 RepID=A0A226M8L3_CALSU|nr:hypothetical protein ASZ78_003475 [Callipepla squamata]